MEGLSMLEMVLSCVGPTYPSVNIFSSLEPFIVKWKRFCRSRFSSGQRRLAKGIPVGTSEPIAFDPGGKMPGPAGWLKRAA